MSFTRSFRWLKRPTRWFGEVDVPIVQIEFECAPRRWQAFAVLLDTGATVSLLRRSAADQLRIRWTEGRLVSLTSVGSAQTSGRLHEISARIDDIAFTLPVVFAENEHVPNLLGRLGLLDAVAVEFDPGPRHTLFRAPGIAAGTTDT
jgi:predicted aspartyl protease